MITKTEIKAVLGFSDTTYDARILALLPYVKSWVLGYINNDFEVKRKYPIDYIDERFASKDVIYLFTNTIQFVGNVAGVSAGYLTDSDSNFINAGFRANFDLRVQDSMYNDKVYSISTVAAGTLTVDISETMTTEDPNSYYIYLTLCKWPDGIVIPMAKIIDIELHKMTTKSINVETKISGDYPKDILAQFKPWKRPVFI